MSPLLGFMNSMPFRRVGLPELFASIWILVSNSELVWPCTLTATVTSGLCKFCFLKQILVLKCDLLCYLSPRIQSTLVYLPNVGIKSTLFWPFRLPYPFLLPPVLTSQQVVLEQILGKACHRQIAAGHPRASCLRLKETSVIGDQGKLILPQTNWSVFKGLYKSGIHLVVV